MYCDLHTHSVFSDGTWTPSQIIDQAARQGLTVALTDHNTVSGLPEFLAAAKARGVEAVAGIEFSTDYMEYDVHVVALFVDAQMYQPIRDYVAQGDSLKEQSNRNLVAALNGAGYAISYDRICAKTPDGRVNRANIAAELVEQGYVPTVKEAFSQLLSAKRGYYIPPKRPGTYETIEFIRSLGALPVLAHPLLTMSEAELRRFLPRAVDAGLLAMETAYTTYDAQTTQLAREIAREYGLLESGGSDFHGDTKPGNLLGQGKGTLQMPYEIYLRLKQAHGCTDQPSKRQ